MYFPHFFVRNHKCRIALSVYSFASIGMRETVSDVETGEKRLGNSKYLPIVRTVVAPAVSRV